MHPCHFWIDDIPTDATDHTSHICILSLDWIQDSRIFYLIMVSLSKSNTEEYLVEFHFRSLLSLHVILLHAFTDFIIMEC